MDRRRASRRLCLDARGAPGVLDLSGVWEGTWNGGPIGRGRITLTLTQAGTKVTGSLKMSGATAISATDGPVEGVVTDTTFSFEQPGGVMQGDMAIVGEEMSGRRHRADQGDAATPAPAAES